MSHGKVTYERISKPASELGDSYEIVVVGSGYGGGVAAARLARAGRQVCVLERGREILPGEYPDELTELADDVQIDTRDGLVGSPVGMFDFRTNPDVNVLVGCGLGGTSLINANVSLEMKADQFQADEWPEALRVTPEGKVPLEPYYETARRVLGANPYPEDYPKLNKLRALELSAEGIGAKDDFYRPPINVHFEDRINPFGVPQPACNNCGDCCSGCNYGSKNTTLMNYLPDARNHHAEIFTLASVVRIARSGDQWELTVQTFDEEGKDAGVTTVRAGMVVLAAGTLGSTEILLRSKSEGLGFSPALGARFSGNGDVLGFGYNLYWENEDGTRPGEEDILAGIVDKMLESVADDAEKKKKNGRNDLDPKPVRGVGIGNPDAKGKPEKDEWPGPCITGIIDLRDGSELEKRLVVEEGVIPGAVAALLPPAFFFSDVLWGNMAEYGPKQMAQRIQDAGKLAYEVQSHPTGLSAQAYRGPTSRTQTYLIMSHDRALGTLVLGDGPHDRVRVDWPGAGRSPVIEHDNLVLRQVNEAVEGEFLPNPIWTKEMGQQIVTVHPVGGCRMSDSPTEGVVNDRCQVYDGNGGVHPGLYVCDGAVMSGAVGVNPLLTITAVAERAMHLLCEERGWKYDVSIPDPQLVQLESRGRVRVNPHAAQEVELPLHELAPEVAAHHESGGILGKIFGAIKKGIIHLLMPLFEDLVKNHPEEFSPSLEFHEAMRGYVSTDVVPDRRPVSQRISDDHLLGYQEGMEGGEVNALVGAFHVKADKIQTLVTDAAHRAALGGTVSCAALQRTGEVDARGNPVPKPMEVKDGSLSLLAAAKNAPETWYMTYECLLESDLYGDLFFFGRKTLHKKEGSALWTDVTRLAVSVYRGKDRTGEVVAQGIIMLTPDDLIRQAMSFKMEPTTDIQRWLEKHFPAAYRALCKVFLAKFAAFFGTTLFKAYGGILADLADFAGQEDEEELKEEHRRRTLKAPTPQKFHGEQVGGRFSMTRYCRKGDSGPVILAPGFSVAASSFAATTVDRNLVEMLVEEDYDVWLFDYQASPDSGHAEEPFTIDDIVDQWQQAIRFVIKTSGASSVQAVAHCMASMTLLMALMRPDGKGPLPVRSAICSQTTLHPVTSWMNYVKTDINLARILANEMKVVDLNTTDPPKGADPDEMPPEVKKAKSLDGMLWNVPVPAGEECTNPTCHRVTSIFGPSWTHSKLGYETHLALREWFGKISTTPFEQLADIMRAGHPVSANGDYPYMDHADKLRLPITFIAGSKNQIFLPETSLRTYEWLRARNKDVPGYYRRQVFEGFAHMDCFVGTDAAEIVFPFILRELKTPPEPSS